MTKIHHIKPLEQIEDEAAAWVWKLDDEHASKETRAAFEAWMVEDLRHRKVYEGLTETWDAFDDLAVLKHQFKLDTIMDGVEAEERKRLWPRSKLIMQVGSIAAVFVVAAISVALFSSQTPVAPAESVTPAVLTYATAVGQQRQVALEDGSTIELNTNTIVEVEYNKAHRLIRLEKGEAHFVVEKDTSRPFIVAAGDTGVRAVGTAFNVYRAPDAPVEVIVTEGVVDLIKAEPSLDVVASFAARPVVQSESQERPPQASAETKIVRLTAGQSFSAAVIEVATIEAASDPVISIPPAVLDQELAWRRGLLVFEGEPLEEVVGELSRYTEARFIITDDAIRSRRVGGRYKTSDVDSLLSVLEQGLDIQVERQGDAIIYLSDASDQTPG